MRLTYGWDGTRCKRRVALVAVLAVAGACSSDAPTASGPVSRLVIVSGDGQHARPGMVLAQPLRVRAVDEGGAPIAGAAVRWETTEGVLTHADTRTDAHGYARGLWRLEDREGEQVATAGAGNAEPVTFTAIADPNMEVPVAALRAIRVPTYDGSGQAVHPDIAITMLAAPGEPTWFAATPYPWGDSFYENPSIYHGQSEMDWAEVPNAHNPVVRPSGAYLSDPDLVRLADRDELWMYYREVSGENRILLTRSADGIGWSTPQLVARGPSHTIVSPAVVRRAPNQWLMWSVNSGSAGCTASSTTVELRRSSDGEHWSAPERVTLVLPARWVWHIDVQWIPELGEYWSLFNAKVDGSCTTAEVYLATSRDGVEWRVLPTPVLRRGVLAELRDIVYRSTFSYDAATDVVSIWYSGAKYAAGGYEWRLAYEQRRRAGLFADATRLAASALAPATTPPLTNRTAP